MDLLATEYQSSEEETTESTSSKRTNFPSNTSQIAKRPKINLAPHVSLEDPKLSTSLYTKPTDTQITVNIPYEDLIQPVVGPNNPFSTRVINQNVLTGHVEEQAYSEFAFRTQQ
ncbi:7669_t:CDS:2, partial [Racocetra persica]